MTNKKFLSISLAVALMVGVVALYSCKEDDPATKNKPAQTVKESGKEAAQELCNCFSNAANQTDEMTCMTEIQGKYSDLFRNQQGEGGNPEFESAFASEFLLNCNNKPDWLICTLLPGNCEPELTGEELIVLGIQAAAEVCECFTGATDQNSAQACGMAFMTKYGSNVTKREFTTALAAGLQSCENVIPDWVREMFDRGQ